MACPVCERAIEVDADRQCPVCDTDLGPLLGWRLHAVALYNQALEAAEGEAWHEAAALLQEARALAPSFAGAAVLHAKTLIRLDRLQDA
jgi:thioredoxin-like negative regulator of GroEL